MAAINHPFGSARRRVFLPAPVGRINWWVVAAIVVVGVSAMLPVVQNSTATDEGFAIQRAQAEQSRLNGEIRVLESDVARLTSLARIERRATEIGLSPAASPYFVTVDEPGPAPAKLPAEYLPRSASETGAPEPWWQSLIEWLPLPD